MKYRIVSDSSSNLYSLEGNIEYRTAPLKILADGEEFVDEAGLDIERMVLKVENSAKNTTSCPNAAEWIQAFEGADCIFGITISSSLSGSFNSAQQAREEYLETHPDVKIHIIDSLSTGGEMEVIIRRLAMLMGQGLSFEEIKKDMTDYQKHTHLMFALESLNNLAKNGRVPMALAKVAGFLGLRFVGKASEQGTLHQEVIARGARKTITAMYNKILELGYKGGMIVISSCLNDEATRQLKEMLQNTFPNGNFITRPLGGLCSYYAERGGMIVGFEDL